VPKRSRGVGWLEWPTDIGWYDTTTSGRIYVFLVTDSDTHNTGHTEGGFVWGWCPSDDPEFVPRDDYDWRNTRFLPVASDE
jgi:hypothetical protein